MLLETLEKRWKAIEEIGSDAEKRGKLLGIEPSWQPDVVDVGTSDATAQKLSAQTPKARTSRRSKNRGQTVVIVRKHKRAAG
ncbi:hypothetical protein EV132_1656 [Rhizobium sullae]|nr:hypothetical protein EV132_1656 [Rhizobium sullae]